MFRHITLIAVITALIVASAPAAAAPNNTTTATTTTTDAPDGSAVTMQLGRHATIQRYWYSAGKFHVILTADLPTLVSVTDSMAGIADSGATDVPFRQVMVDGRTEVVMDVTEFRGGAAVSVGTNDALVRLSTGVTAANPYSYGTPGVGWLGGLSVALVMAFAAYRRIDRSDDPLAEDLTDL